MNTYTAEEIVGSWFGTDLPIGKSVIDILAGLLPEPDVWAINHDRLLTISRRSLFETTYDTRTAELRARRIVINDDGHTQITIAAKTADSYGAQAREWHVLFAQPASAPIEITATTETDQSRTPPMERLLRHLAELAGWQGSTPESF